MSLDRVVIVQAACLQRWGTTPSHMPVQPCTPAQTPRYLECPFPVNPEINNKIAIWEGDIALLEADGIIAGTNEYTPPRRTLTERVFQRGRPRGEGQAVLDVGEVKVVEEPCIVAKYLIYTVTPKFRPRNRTTSDHELHTAYRNVLDRARQLGLTSLGLGILHSARKNYPPNYGAHIGLRTLRRYLEHYPDAFDVVVLVVDTFTHGLYERILSLYFPRTPIEEEAACWKLPAPIGGPWGEPIIEQSEMRITENPQNIFEEDEYEGAAFSSRQQVSEHPFTRMESDLDTERLLGGRQVKYSTGDPILDIIMKDFEEKGRYERMLRRARSEDLTEISKLGCIYQNGTDRLGRPVVIFIGKWFRAREANHNKFFLYLISLMDSIVNNDYVIIYFHTKTTQENRPPMNWFTSVYNILPYKYKKNLKAVYIVHPSFWTKSLTWWFTKFLAPAIKKKIHTVTGIEYLYSVILPRELEIPAFITEYDMSINGVHYFRRPKHLESEEEDSYYEPIPARLRASLSEPQASTSGFGSLSRHPRPSTSVAVTAIREPRPSTSGLGSSTREPRPSTSGLSSSTWDIRPSKSQVETSTWELRQSKSGFRFTKLEPRSSKTQAETHPEPSTSKARKSGSPPERGEGEPQPGPSTSQAGPSTSEPKTGPATPELESDPWKVLLSPATSELCLATSRSEPVGWKHQKVRSTSEVKLDPWMLQKSPTTSKTDVPSQSEQTGQKPPPVPSTSQAEPDLWELLPSPSTSEPELAAADPQTMASSSKTPSKPLSSKSAASKKKSGRKKRSSVSDLASTLQ